MSHLNIRIIPLLAATALAGTMACGGDATGPDPDGATQITLTGSLTFSPADVTIDPGTTVRWVNGTSIFHTVTPVNLQQQGIWARTTTSNSGTVLSHTFTVSGQVYNYFCEVHAGMTGIIRVR